MPVLGWTGAAEAASDERRALMEARCGHSLPYAEDQGVTYSTRIISNGSGRVHPDLGVLLDLLAREPLDSIFEAYGNFIVTQDAVLAPDEVQFCGNFANYSHVFDVRTSDPTLIAKLTTAIRANQSTRAYRKAAEELAALKRRHRERFDAEEVRRRQRDKEMARRLLAQIGEAA